MKRDNRNISADSGAKSLNDRLEEIWNNPVQRGWIYQALVVLFLSWVGYWLFSNTLRNLEQQGITSGFAFLQNEAGFGIIQSLIPYSEASSFLQAFLTSLINTIIVSILGIIFATLLGFTIGIMRLSSNILVKSIARIYVETFRNVPLLLQILFWYVAVLKPLPSPRDVFSQGDLISLSFTNRGVSFATPTPEDGFSWVVIALIVAFIASFILAKWAKHKQKMTGKIFPVIYAQLAMIIILPSSAFLVCGTPLHFIPAEMGRFRLEGGSIIIIEFIALWLALSIYTASFIAEIVRAGIQSVSYGQTEAARTLGISSWKTMRLVILPQALRVIIPPLTNQYLNLTKNSSLAAAIAYPDLVSVFTGTVLSQTGQAIEVMGMTLAVYLSLSLITSAGMNVYNKRITLVTR